MRILKLLYIAVGLALLAAVFTQVDFDEVIGLTLRVGALGMMLVLAVYAAGFVIDSFTWQMAMIGVPLSARWLWRAFKVRMVGEVFNTVMPAAGMGGEPVKAILLNRHYGLGYREATASIILGRTINMVSQMLFLAVGFVMVWMSDLSAQFKGFAAMGLAAFVAATAIFFYAQRLRVASFTGTWLGRREILARINDILHHIRDMDERLVRFYTQNRARFAAAIGLAFLNWIAGVVEIYVTMYFLGHPVSWSAAQLVRSAAFFIPAAVGAQEGAFLLVCAAMTGQPALGVAVSLVRRVRELMWLLFGVGLGALYAARPAPGGKSR
ncbi:MAG: flippase-like domain-containing protein [Alphaproteobacteria bacterium]|nr:flippase-like domain-containing protein [Alphaproteobacteria bacterium]